MQQQLLGMALLAGLVGGAGCRATDAADKAGAEGTEPSAGGQPVEELLPTPYTAEQIRIACQPGSELHFRIDGAKGQPITQVMRFTADDGTHATLETWMEILGNPMGPPETQHTEWAELQAHASFPAGTVRERDTITVEAGTFEAWRYRSEFTDHRGTGHRTMWFADRTPGPPVLMSEYLGDVEVQRMELVARAKP